MLFTPPAVADSPHLLAGEGPAGPAIEAARTVPPALAPGNPLELAGLPLLQSATAEVAGGQSRRAERSGTSPAVVPSSRDRDLPSLFSDCALADLSAGGFHTLAVTGDGQVYAWGHDAYGQLGDGGGGDRGDPRPVGGLPPARRVSGGLYHSLAVGRDGSVWAWGQNGDGQLGDGTTVNAGFPVAVSGLAGARAVAAGWYHSLVLLGDGSVWASGDNSRGQLGDGTTLRATAPVQVRGLPADIAGVAAGGFHSLAVTRSGALFAWGMNVLGQLGDGGFTDSPLPVPVAIGDVRAVAAGVFHSLAARGDGTVLAWGFNQFGQLGDGSFALSPLPVAAIGLTGAVAVAAREQHSVVLDSTGGVWTFGLNSSGQLGDGTTAPSPVALRASGFAPASLVAAGAGHTIAAPAAGGAQGVGLNLHGQIGMGTTGSFAATAVAARGPSNVARVAAGLAHSLALVAGGQAWSWGDGGDGRLGLGTTAQAALPAAVPTLGGLVALAAGSRHSLWAAADGTVWATGSNDSGQLGNGSALPSASPVAVSGIASASAVAAGAGHSLALLADGTLRGWGRNGSGQLGDGTTANRATPVAVAPGLVAVAIAAGLDHSLALAADGTVWAWGRNGQGQLGDGTTTTRRTPVAVAGLTGVVAVAAGHNHSLAVRSDGTVWAWGDNSSGQLGDGTTTRRLRPVAATGLVAATAVAGGAAHSLALLADGTLASWGDNSEGQLGRPAPGLSPLPAPVAGLAAVTAIAAGARHSLVADATGRVLAWGRRSSGQLGDGSAARFPAPVAALLPAAPEVTAIEAAGTPPAACTVVETFRAVATGSPSSWSFVITPPVGGTAKPGSGTLPGGASAELGAALAGRGIFLVSMTASNSCGSASRTLAFELACANQPPVAMAGGPYASSCRDAAIDGATAEDPDGDELAIAWSSTSPDVAIAPAGGSLPGGPGLRRLPPAAATLAAGVPPCGVEADLVLEVADGFGHTAASLARVRFDDRDDPALAGVPPDERASCERVPAPAAVAAGDACDPAPALALDERRTDGACADSYHLTRQWSARDHCGNTTVARQLVTVVDETAPALIGVPPGGPADCAAVPPPARPAAGDNCDPAPAVSFAERRIDGSCPGNYTLVREWTATDRCGNAAVERQAIEVRDTTAPVVVASTAVGACLWPPDHRMVCFARADFAPALGDDCSAPVAWRFAGCASNQPEDSTGDGSTGPDCQVAPGGASFCVRAERSGGLRETRLYTVTVIATDACGNAGPPTPIATIAVPHSRAPHAGCR